MITKIAHEMVKEAYIGLMRAAGLSKEDRQLLREHYGLGGGDGGLMLRNEGRSTVGGLVGGALGGTGGALLGAAGGVMTGNPTTAQAAALLGGNLGLMGGGLYGAYKGGEKYSKTNADRIRRLKDLESA